MKKDPLPTATERKVALWLLIRRNRLPAKISELVVSDLPDQTAYRYSFLSFASLIPKSLN